MRKMDGGQEDLGLCRKRRFNHK